MYVFIFCINDPNVLECIGYSLPSSLDHLQAVFYYSVVRYENANPNIISAPQMTPVSPTPLPTITHTQPNGNSTDATDYKRQQTHKGEPVIGNTYLIPSVLGHIFTMSFG